MDRAAKAGIVVGVVLAAGVALAVRALGTAGAVHGARAKFRVLSTPALVVDGTVKSAGRVLIAEAIKDLLRA